MWTLALLIPLVGIIGALILGASQGAALVVGLAVFAFVVATDSAMHSYLIVSYSHADNAALRIGFYYMANAGGRWWGRSCLAFSSSRLDRA